MGIRSSLATSAMTCARAFGNALGCEVAVEFSDHSIETKMVVPSSSGKYAWDPDLYVRGNAFYQGYANPIKPQVEKRESIKDPDTADVETGNADGEEDSRHVSLISSIRYKVLAQNNTISQLINPQQQLTIIQWALIGMGVLLAIMFILLAAIAANVGVF